MRRILLGSTALIGAGLASVIASQPASAADGIKLSVGGYFRTAYMVLFDDDGVHRLARASKLELARALIRHIAKLYRPRKTPVTA